MSFLSRVEVRAGHSVESAILDGKKTIQEISKHFKDESQGNPDYQEMDVPQKFYPIKLPENIREPDDALGYVEEHCERWEGCYSYLLSDGKDYTVAAFDYHH
jgi:hypothetical protein